MSSGVAASVRVQSRFVQLEIGSWETRSQMYLRGELGNCLEFVFFKLGIWGHINKKIQCRQCAKSCQNCTHLVCQRQDIQRNNHKKFKSEHWGQLYHNSPDLVIQWIYVWGYSYKEFQNGYVDIIDNHRKLCDSSRDYLHPQLKNYDM